MSATLRKTFQKILKWGIYYPLLTVVCLEVALLILGYRRYITDVYKVVATPENAYIGNDSLGIELNPGQYSLTLNDSVQFIATHDLNHQRHTYRPYSDTIEKRIILLGCSFTYGYGVNDAETFASKIQSKHPNWTIENHGVIGYGTVQSYMQLKSILSINPPDALILNFSSFHFMRNVLSQAYRKNLKLGYANSSTTVDSLMQSAQFPFVQDTSCKIEFAGWDQMHENWWAREWLASVNWFQTFYEQQLDADLKETELTAAIINKMSTECLEKNVKFGIVCLDSSEATRDLKLRTSQSPWKDVGFDFTNTDLTHLPYDSHPNQKGHALIADKIDSFLSKILANE